MYIKTTNTIATMNRPYTKNCFKHSSRRHLIANCKLPFFQQAPPSISEPPEPAASLSQEEKGRYSQPHPPLAWTAAFRELLQVLDLLKTSARATEIPSELSDNVPTQIWMSCQNYIIIFFLNHYTLKSELPWWLHWLHLQCHYWQSNASYSDTSPRRFSSHISTSRNLKPVLWFDFCRFIISLQEIDCVQTTLRERMEVAEATTKPTQP